MAVYKKDIVDIELNSGNVHRSFLKHSLGKSDMNADHFGIRVFRGGEPVDLSDVSVQGFFKDPQGTNIAITSGNIVGGNQAEVVLPQACYNYEGQFCLAIKLVGGGVTGTMRIVDGMIDNTNTGSAVAPTGAVPTYQEVLASYDAAIAAVDDVNKMKSTTIIGIDGLFQGEYKEHNAGIIEGGLNNSGGNYNTSTRARTYYTPITPGTTYQVKLEGLTWSVMNAWVYSGTTQGTVIRKLDLNPDKNDFIFTAGTNENDLRVSFYYSADSTHVITSEERGDINQHFTIRRITDRTLTKQNAAADAKATGDRFAMMRSRFNGKKISIIGDSIDTYDKAGYKIDGYAMYYPALGVDDVSKTWWKQVIDTSGAALEVNASYSGSRVTNTRSTGPDFYDRVDLIGSPDVIFVTLGTNDSNYDIALGSYDFDTTYTELDESTFRPAYIKGVKGLQALHPNADIICIAQKMDAAYKNSIITIANTLGCTFIDASDYLAQSGVHPGVKGMLQLAALVLFPTDETFTQKHIPADAKKTAERFTQSDANIAPLYSELNTYSKGDYVYYNNNLYKCVRAITTGEAFDSLKWKKTSLDKEIETDEINYSQSRRFTGSALFLNGWKYGGNITDYGQNNYAFICDNQYNALKASGSATIYNLTLTTETDRRIHISGKIRDGESLAGRYFNSAGKLSTTSAAAAAIIPADGLNYRIVAFATGLQTGQKVDVRRHFYNSASVSVLMNLTSASPYAAVSLTRQDLANGNGACIGLYSENDGSTYDCDIYLAFIPYANDEDPYEDEDGYSYDSTFADKYVYTSYYNRYIEEYAEPVVLAQSDVTVTMKSYLQYKATENIISEAKARTANPYLIYQEKRNLILNDGNLSYRVQGIAYDSNRKRYGIICPAKNGDGTARLLLESDLSSITGTTYFTVWSGHSNDITYVPETDQFVIACHTGGGPDPNDPTKPQKETGATINSYVCCVDAETGNQTFYDLSPAVTQTCGIDYYNGAVYVAGPNALIAYEPDMTLVGKVSPYMTKTACIRAFRTTKMRPYSFYRAGLCIIDGIIYATYSFRMESSETISYATMFMFDLRNGELLGMKSYKGLPGEELEGMCNVDGVLYLIHDGTYITARIWDMYHGDVSDNKYLFINANTDLNDVKIDGDHVSRNGATTQTLTNIPAGLTTSFHMEVKRSGGAALYQKIYAYNGKIYYRQFDSDNDVWLDWYEIPMTLVE